MAKLLGKYEILKQADNSYICMLSHNKRENEYVIFRLEKEKIQEIEAKMFKQLENLNHENILNFQVEQDDKYYYLIRETLEGYNIIGDTLIYKFHKSYFICFKQICNALSYIHEKGIAHGCLDYSSIYVDISKKDEEDIDENDIKSYLLDVGFSYIHILNPKKRRFASPEQNNNKITYSIQSDIYSLAQIMLNIYYNNDIKNPIIYTENKIMHLIYKTTDKYAKEILNLFLNMVKDNPDDRWNINQVSEKLDYCYRLYVNEYDDYNSTVALKFTKKIEEAFEEEFECYDISDKQNKIDKLAKERVLFKETRNNYIIILSDYVFLCSKDKFGEDNFIKPVYFLVVSFSKVSDRDYRDAINITNSTFEYFNSNNTYNYENPKEFAKKWNSKKDEKYKDTKTVKQEDVLLKSTKNVIDRKKIYYKCKVHNINNAYNKLMFEIIDDEIFAITDKKKTSSILKKYYKDDIKYDDLAIFIKENVDELLEKLEYDISTENFITKYENVCSLFDGAIEYKNNMEMVLKPNDDIIISNDKGKEYSGKIIDYNNSNNTVNVEINKNLFKNFVQGDEYKFCYDYQIKEIILNKQRQAFDDIINGVSHIDKLIKKILEPNKYLTTYDNLANIEKYYNDKLDDNQKEAVKKACNLQKDAEILLIQGPPGTGKTTVITEIVKQYVAKNSNNKILVASQSNQAVDNVLEKVCDEHKVIRIGSDKDKMSKIAQKYIDIEVLNTLLQKNMNKLKEESLLNNNQNQYHNVLANISNKLGNNKKDNDNKKKDNDKAITYFTAPIQVIFATLIGISSWKNFRDIVFDVVIVDEAGRALISELAVPIRKAKKIILVGDHKQLAPVMDDEVIEDVVKTAKKIDEYRVERNINYKDDLQNYNFFGELYDKLSSNSNAKHFLEYNYRAHSTICKLYSEAFYEGQLKSDIALDNTKKHGLSIYKSSVVLLDTKKSNKRFDSQAGTGKINKYNVTVIKDELENIINNIKENNLQHKSIGVITPYRAQTDYLKSRLKNIIVDEAEYLTIDIGTVDSFQGSDRDYIIYDSVRSSNNKIGNIKFISDEKRLNVSLSRAKELLIMVADSKFLMASGKGNSKWPDILKIIQNSPNIYETIEKGDL